MSEENYERDNIDGSGGNGGNGNGGRDGKNGSDGRDGRDGSYRKSDYFYDLPERLIAQDPLERRDESRLMVMNRQDGSVTHSLFKDITGYLKPGDCLVLNDSRVIPARLLGVREGGGGSSQVEVLLLKRKSLDTWECIVRPGKKLRKGDRAVFGDGALIGEITDVLPDGDRIVTFTWEGIFEEVLEGLGQMPLPPYITHKLSDPSRYNTVYARYDGSAAAPTAGLHFTRELLEKIRSMGVKTAYVTLHVGLGTFRPVKEENILDHHMHTETYSISEETAGIINDVRSSGSGRVICVGTTSCRTLESAADEKGRLKSVEKAETDIFIYPGYRFRVMDALITNFHLPESTLIMLVSAFAGRERVLSAYREAVKKEYRFFSLGDAMLIL